MHAGKAFRDADEDVINALRTLGAALYPEEETVALVEKNVCQLYQPRTNISKLKDLNWCKFKENQVLSDNSPGPLPDDCYNSDSVCSSRLPQTDGYGWAKEGDESISVVTKQAPAP